ncbi:MAG: peptidylprolyl isomerase [Barnesiella sp.]|nr:peptidylprolyl isomerase [Barnesiella sp.]MDE6081448.1 peptidylprolyl isomerase [Muribaculaceae bacterium]
MKFQKIFIALLSLVAFSATAQNNIVEEVAWTIGDQPIYKSEIEELYQQLLYERTPINGDPYCVIPERLAIEKLFLHQADIDTVEVQESMVSQQVDSWINYLVTNIGTKEKVEEYFRKSIPELREWRGDQLRNQSRVDMVKRNMVKDIKITPSDVQRYYQQLPEDSIPFVPLQVEVQIITINPVIPREEIDDVKARLREYSDRVVNGETSFSTLATLYSEDPGSALHGGEIGFMGRGHLEPEYAAVAFNLNDPKKVSKIVETQYGYHIIQLIEKRGDRINTRHILLRPKVAQEDLRKAQVRLDSVVTQMRDGKFTFEDATSIISQDKDTRFSRGTMTNDQNGTTRFEMSQLPQEIAKVVDKLEPGEISDAFVMMDPKRNREVVAIVKLTQRIPAHKANLADDFQTIKQICENAAQEKIVKDWLKKKIKDTYVRIEDNWSDCTFENEGWKR